jgi:hypothetical protein
VDQVGVSHGSRQPSLRLQVLPTVFYLQGWMQYPEDWIKWVMAFHEIKNLMPMKEPADKTSMFRALLKGQALSYFEHHLMRRLETEESDVPDNELIELLLQDVGLEYIPKRAIRVQKYYMRHPRGLYMGLNTSIQQFLERLNHLNRYLLYFPEENPKQLDQDEILEILDQAKARYHEWHEAMVNANIDTFEISDEQFVSYFKRLENLEKIRRTHGPNPSSLPVVWANLLRIIRCSTCGVTIMTRTNTTRLIAEQFPNLKIEQQKKACFEANAGPRKMSLAFLVLFEENNALTRQLKPEKTASSKKRNEKG